MWWLVLMFRFSHSSSVSSDSRSESVGSTVDEAVRPDGQVEAVPGLGQVPDGGAPPDAVEGVEGHRADAGGVGVVVVRAVGVPGGPASVVEGLLIGVPFAGCEPPGQDGAVAAVEVVVDVEVVLDPPEVREQVPEAPLVVALRGPPVVVFGYASEEYLGIDGAGATDDAAPGHQHGLGLVGRPADVVPAELAVRAEGPGPDVPVAAMAQPNLVGQLRDVGVVRAGLQQQDRAARVLGEPRCNYRTSSAGANDDGVVVHPDPSAGATTRSESRNYSSVVRASIAAWRDRIFGHSSPRAQGQSSITSCRSMGTGTPSLHTSPAMYNPW